MIARFTFFILLSLGISGVARAQSKADKKAAKQLKTDICFLASDDLEGRRTSSNGEEKAAVYIESRYKAEKIAPFKNTYKLPFHFIYGKEVGMGTQILVANTRLQLKEDAFPLPFSASKHASGELMPDVLEQGNIWAVPVYTNAEQANDPHFEALKYMYEKAKEVEKQGAIGVVFYDSYGSSFAPVFDRHSEYDALGIPVVYIGNAVYQKYFTGPAMEKGAIPVDINVAIIKAERTGINIAAYIDNKAKYTVILGAHFDHLGYGEDGNSLFANAVKEHKIHHGADDNASGTAALMEMAHRIKKNKRLKHYNYLFVHFSGEELGLYGSKAFVKDMGIDSAHFAFMINMDMVGRLNDSTHALTLGGVGTSPAWGEVVEMGSHDFKLNIDSSGAGPSDHTSFYFANMPVLFFFTGSHKDYHKPSDTAGAINYPGELMVIKYIERVVAKMDKADRKPEFALTKQKTIGKSAFKVTLGIMPDYTFETGGVRVDGVSNNRPAIKAGIKQGDIITRLGDMKINGMQSYMDALGKFSPGDKTNVTIVRDSKEMVLPIELTK
jgi:aminopeptidase YwaD